MPLDERGMLYTGYVVPPKGTMEALLEKTQSTLDLVNANTMYAQYCHETNRHVLMVNRETYEDLGMPEQITITIEPGDTLNP